MTFTPGTRFFLPGHISSTRTPEVSTLDEIFESRESSVGDLISRMEADGRLEALPEDADEERWIEDLSPLMSLGDVRSLTDDPNVELFEDSTDEFVRKIRRTEALEPGARRLAQAFMKAWEGATPEGHDEMFEAAEANQVDLEGGGLGRCGLESDGKIDRSSWRWTYEGDDAGVPSALITCWEGQLEITYLRAGEDGEEEFDSLPITMAYLLA